jgi:hypothetical protein
MNTHMHVSYVTKRGMFGSLQLTFTEYDPATIFEAIYEHIKSNYVRDGEFIILSINVFPPPIHDQRGADGE